MSLFSFFNYSFRQSKIFFWISVIIFTGSIFTAFLTITIWPFFNYSMYAYPIKDEASHTTTELIINDEVFLFYKHLPYVMATTIENETNFYVNLKENNFEDPFLIKLKKRGITLPKFTDKLFKYPHLNDRDFSIWLKRYIQNRYDIDIKTITLNKIQISFTPFTTVIRRQNIFTTTF